MNLQEKTKGSPARRYWLWLPLGFLIGTGIVLAFLLALFEIRRDTVFTTTAYLVHDDYLQLAYYGPNMQSIYTSSSDGTFRIWDLEGRQNENFMQDYQIDFWSSRWNQAQNQLLAVKYNSAALIFDSQGEVVNILEHNGVDFAAWSPNDDRIMTYSQNQIKIWRLDGHLVQSFSLPNNHLKNLEWAPDGSRFVFWWGEFNGTDYSLASAKIYDRDGQELAAIDFPHPPTQVLWNTDSSRFATLSYLPNSSPSEFLFDVYNANGEKLVSNAVDYQNPAISWNPSGNRLMLMNYEAEIILSLWTVDGEFINEMPTGNIFTWNETNNYLLTASQIEQDLFLRDADGEILHTLSHNGDASHTIPVWSPNGEMLASWSSNPETGEYNLYIWDKEGNLLQNISQTSSIETLLWSPDNSKILSIGGFVARLWSVDGYEINALHHSQPIIEAVFSPENGRIRTVAAYPLSNSIENALWTESGEHLTTFYTGDATLTYVADWRSDFAQVLLQSSNHVEILNLEAGPIWFDFRLD